MRLRFALYTFLLLCFALARAQSTSFNGYTLSNADINLVISISEKLAEAKISNIDKAEIVNWTIEDFKSAPEAATPAYGVLAEWLNILNSSPSQFEYDLAKYRLWPCFIPTYFF